MSSNGRVSRLETDAATPIERARVLALAETLSNHLADKSAQRLATALEQVCLGVFDGDLGELDPTGEIADAAASLPQAAVKSWLDQLDELERDGISASFVCDNSFPENLALVHDRPPIIFWRGSLDHRDDRAVAVVGTRSASEAGAAFASTVARELAESGITVVSGLADGIDVAAHASALNSGGRTIAVLGTGISVQQPARKRSLASRIVDHGALVSQFWPTQTTTRWTLPIRNRVTSGLSIATVVAEAGETSGARLQAKDAVAHGRRVFLHDPLVTRQPWAAEMISRGHARPVTSASEVMEAVAHEFGSEPIAFA